MKTLSKIFWYALAVISLTTLLIFVGGMVTATISLFIIIILLT